MLVECNTVCSNESILVFDCLDIVVLCYLENPVVSIIQNHFSSVQITDEMLFTNKSTKSCL